eukprot:s383_g34.t1
MLQSPEPGRTESAHSSPLERAVWSAREPSFRLGRGLGRHGAQVQPLQEGTLEVPLEVEEEAHAPLAEEAPKDAPALEVKRCLQPAQMNDRAVRSLGHLDVHQFPT